VLIQPPFASLEALRGPDANRRSQAWERFPFDDTFGAWSGPRPCARVRSSVAHAAAYCARERVAPEREAPVHGHRLQRRAGVTSRRLRDRTHAQAGTDVRCPTSSPSRD
jgi:hypothetical protein